MGVPALMPLLCNHRLCGGLNKNGPYRPVVSNTIRRYHPVWHVGGSVSLEASFEVLGAQVWSVCLSLFLLPVDPKVEPSATSPARVLLCIPP